MHPCCNGSLQRGTKIIAIVQLVGSILLIILGILGLTAGGVVTSKGLKEKKDSISINSDDDSANHAEIGIVLIVGSVVLLVTGIVSVITSILLLIGANKRNRTMCMIWFVLTAICLIVTLLSTLNGFVSGEPAFRPVGRIFGLMLQSYFMWVVWAFIRELKE